MFRRSLGAAVTAVLVFSAPLAAQGTAPAEPPLIRTVPYPTVGVSAGISLPLGEFARTHEAGFNLGAVAEMRQPSEAVGVRGEFLYQHFAGKPATGAIDNSTLALTVNVLYHLPGYSFHPYLIAGMGFYHLSDAGNHPGLNAGGGVEIPLVGMSAFLEARVHRALADNVSSTTLPITFGVTF